VAAPNQIIVTSQEMNKKGKTVVDLPVLKKNKMKNKLLLLVLLSDLLTPLLQLVQAVPLLLKRLGACGWISRKNTGE
jgi:hypothetical protein